MPVQQLRQQPAPALVLRLIHSVRQAGAQRVDQLVHCLLRLTVLCLIRLWHDRPGQCDAQFIRQLSSLPFQPVT